MLLICRVAIRTIGFEMCADNFKIGEFMVEIVFVENYDLRIPAFVIRVAR